MSLQRHPGHWRDQDLYLDISRQILWTISFSSDLSFSVYFCVPTLVDEAKIYEGKISARFFLTATNTNQGGQNPLV